MRRQSTSTDSGLRAIGGDWSQTAYGVGIRLATPFAPLIRVDYGRLFSPRAGEPGGRWFLGIGQAF